MAGWKARRERRLRLLFAAWLVANILVYVAIVAWRPEALEGLVAPLWRTLQGLAPWLQDATVRQALLSAGVSGLIGGLATLPILILIHDRWFSDFDDEILTRLKRLEPSRVGQSPLQEHLETQLRWVRPTKGPRRDVWDALDSRVRRDSIEPRRWLPWGSMRAARFDEIVLLGRAGGGKSRMALELGRALANRRRFGQGRKARLARFQTWLRTNVFFSKRSNDDPWDAAWIAPKPTKRFEEIASDLVQWRPRRPTLLILDDPASDQLKSVRESLLRSSKQWSHPVRLLIVSQTLPREFGATWDEITKIWRLPGGHPLADPPIELGEACWFTPEEVMSHLADPLVTSLQVQALMRRRDVLERVYAITRGNPLLVALTVTWLKDGYPFEEMTPARLLTRRGERIMAALAVADVTSPRALLAMAAATMADGANRQDLHRALAHDETPRTSALRLIFPNAAEAGPDWIPPFRPELLGEAFVRAVIQQTGGNEAATMIVRAGWQLNPSRMMRLRGRPRSAPNPYDPTTPDPLSLAIRDVDPRQVGEIRIADLALADMDVALYEARDELFFGARSDRRGDALQMLSSIAELDPGDARMVAKRLRAIFEDLELHIRRGLRLDAFFAASVAALERCPERTPAEADADMAWVSALLESDLVALTNWDFEVGRPAGHRLKSIVAALGAEATLEMARFDQLRETFWQRRDCPVFIAAMGLEGIAGARPGTETAAVASAQAAAVHRENPMEIHQERPNENMAAGLAVWGPRAEARGIAAYYYACFVRWSRPGLENDPIKRLIELAAKHPDDEAVASAYAEALAHRARILSSSETIVASPENIEIHQSLSEIDDQLTKISRRFPQAFSIRRAQADVISTLLQWLHNNVPDSTAPIHQCIRRIVAIADSPPPRIDLTRIACQLLDQDALFRGSGSEAEAALATANRRTVIARLADGFPAHAEFRAYAIRDLAHQARDVRRQGGDIAARELEMLTKRALEIGKPFSASRHMQHSLVSVIGALVRTYASLPAGTGAWDAERTAEWAGELWERYGDSYIAERFAEMLSDAASAHAARPLGVGAADAERIADTIVNRLALPEGGFLGARHFAKSLEFAKVAYDSAVDEHARAHSARLEERIIEIARELAALRTVTGRLIVEPSPET